MLKKLFNKLFGNNQDNISFRQGFDLTGFPIVTFYQGKHKLNFILDTGSTDNIIDSTVVKDLEYEKADHQCSLTGMDGIVHTVPAYNISLEYNGNAYPYLYLVKDLKDALDEMKRQFGVTIHGMLGSKFFNEYKYIINFDEMVAYSKKQ